MPFERRLPGCRQAARLFLPLQAISPPNCRCEASAGLPSHHLPPTAPPACLPALPAPADHSDLDARNVSTRTYPASYPVENVIAVASTNETDGLAPFSNYGGCVSSLVGWQEASQRV